MINAGAKTAVNATKNGKIGVIGTEGTVNSGIYGETMKRMKADIEVTEKSCPLLVPLVEEGLLHDSVTDEIASRYLSELKGKYIEDVYNRQDYHRLPGRHTDFNSIYGWKGP